MATAPVRRAIRASVRDCGRCAGVGRGRSSSSSDCFRLCLGRPADGDEAGFISAASAVMGRDGEPGPLSGDTGLSYMTQGDGRMMENDDVEVGHVVILEVSSGSRRTFGEI